MGLGNVFATMMMFAILVVVFFTLVNINKHAMVTNSELLKMKQKNALEKGEQGISIVPGINFTVFQQYSINITNTGNTIMPISELSIYLSNKKIPDEDISSVIFVSDVVNPGLWDPSEIIQINFTAARSQGIHTFKVATGQGMTESITLSLTTCRNAQPYYPNVANLYSTVVKGDGTWTTTFQPDEINGVDNFIYQASGGNDNHGVCNNNQVGVTTNAATIRRTLLFFNISLLPQSCSVTESMFGSRVFTVGTGDKTTDVHRVTQAWTEGGGSCTLANEDHSGSTWNTYNGVNNWASAGGDFDPVPEDSVVAVDETWLLFDLSSLVKAWYNTTYDDNGIIMKSANDGATQTYVQSRSFNYTTATLTPYLNVTYDPYCFDITVVN